VTYFRDIMSRMLENSSIRSVQYYESSALQFMRFAETAERYFANPELAKSYREEARSDRDLAATFYSLSDPNS